VADWDQKGLRRCRERLKGKPSGAPTLEERIFRLTRGPIGAKEEEEIVFNGYFADRYAKDRVSDAMKSAEINRLAREARANKPTLAGRLLLSIGRLLVSWGSKWQERHEGGSSLQKELSSEIAEQAYKEVS
jgi:hypothetical protein